MPRPVDTDANASQDRGKSKGYKRSPRKRVGGEGVQACRVREGERELKVLAWNDATLLLITHVHASQHNTSQRETKSLSLS